MAIEKFKLLYIDDHPQTREWMKMMLEDDVSEFLVASNGQEGLDIYDMYEPDIILSDIDMPIMDGLSMAKKIKEKDKEKPILIMSAFDEKDILVKAIDIGIDYFIAKPVDMDKLMEKLEHIAKDLQNKIDSDKLKKKELQTLFDLAHYDTLTNIPNRFLFDIRLEEVISKTKRKNTVFSLFFIDLDNFKNINDTYGHVAGDKILCFVSENIQSVIRKEDFFARIGGDEFVLIIEDIDDEKYISKLAKKILKVSSKSLECQGKNINVTASVGIARFPKDSDLKKELLHLSDTAMYMVKKAGKSSYVYVSDL